MSESLFAVFGNPVLHSKSPQLFKSAFSELAIEANYTRIRPSNAADVVGIVKQLNILGANITTPFKTQVIPFLDSVSNDALKIEGVNTILNRSGKLLGFNTDYLGVSRALRGEGLHLQGSKCLVLGAGPAARAAAYAMVKEGANVKVINRTTEKALKVANDFGCEYALLSEIGREIKEVDIVVSALLPDANPLAQVEIPSRITFLDANYRFSNISTFARNSGCMVISGEKWLLHQAVASMEIFLEQEVDVEVMQRGLLNNLNRKNLKICTPYDSWNDVYTSDLVISAPKNSNLFTSILHEEISKAFEN